LLAAVRWGAVILGFGAGGIAATVLALFFWLLFSALGVQDAPLAGLTLAILLGFATAGVVAGRLTRISHHFHGSLAALGLASMVVVIARLGGSPAPTPQVLLLAGLAIFLGSVGGLIGKRLRGLNRRRGSL